MTVLIKKQILIIFIMFFAGMTAGMIDEVCKIANNIFLRIIGFMVIGCMIGEYLYYCNDGKINFVAVLSTYIGLSLWKSCICGKIKD